MEIIYEKDVIRPEYGYPENVDDVGLLVDPIGEITSDYLTRIFGDILTIDSAKGTRTVGDVVQEVEAFMSSPMVQEIMAGVDRLVAMYEEFCRGHNHNQDDRVSKNIKDENEILSDDDEDDGHGHASPRQRFVHMYYPNTSTTGGEEGKNRVYLSLSNLIMKYLLNFSKK